MENKFTPGPWTIHNETEIHPENDPNGYHVIADIDPDTDCKGAERKANAQLIAAAPELLENLQQLCELLESIGHDVTPARQAIAKATQ